MMREKEGWGDTTREEDVGNQMPGVGRHIKFNWTFKQQGAAIPTPTS